MIFSLKKLKAESISRCRDGLWKTSKGGRHMNGDCKMSSFGKGASENSRVQNSENNKIIVDIKKLIWKLVQEEKMLPKDHT